MSKKKKVMLSVHELVAEITGRDCVFQDRAMSCSFFKYGDEENLHFILTEKFFGEGKEKIFDKLTGPVLKEMMLAADEDNKAGVVSIREELAEMIGKDKKCFTDISEAKNQFKMIFREDNRHSEFSIEKLPGIYRYLLVSPVSPTSWLARNSSRKVTQEFTELDKKLDVVRKSILYLYSRKRYPDFFWWLFLFALFQSEIVHLLRYLPDIQYKTMMDYLELKDKSLLELRRKPLVVVQEEDFWDIRRKLIKSAVGHLILMGPSLKDAFDRRHRNCIRKELTDAVANGLVSKVTILLTDPIVFNDDSVCSDPKDDVDRTMKVLQEHFYSLFERNEVELSICFLPFLQIDHAVITEEFMLFRSNKLWNCERKYKGSFTMHTSNYYTASASEYEAQVGYVHTVMENSTIIFPQVDIGENEWDSEDARSYHKKWREYLKNKDYQYVSLYKVYDKQIHSYVCCTWRKNNDDYELLTAGASVRGMEDFWNPKKLLNDRTQQVLLPYLKETEEMFTEAIKKHDRHEDSYCHLYPSLDLGFPNNVCRLAGGFATGMLVTWNCGTDIVPVDATVNVCTSSVFKLDGVNREWFSNPQSFYDLVDRYAKEASEEKGYSFSFQSGNHFLTVSRDKDSGEYYLVLHSSANELKHSYMGLYPVENNWYSGKIKPIKGKNGRYFRYLKDEDARYFIRMVKNFQEYNEQIHRWIAERINGGPVSEREKWMAHHYYMPTDQSIAIGTFAEPVGTEIPMFSAHGKPVYIFRIGPDNFQIDLGGKKGRVCLIPHGWGQKIDGIDDVLVRDGKLILKIDGEEKPFPISSQERIQNDQKRIREFSDGKSFLKAGNGYIQGEFIKELTPLVEYSGNTIGK